MIQPNSTTNWNWVSAFDSSWKGAEETLIGPWNSGFPCSIDGLRVLATDACRQILATDECWELYASGLEKAHIPTSKYGCNRDTPRASMPHSLQSRLDCGYRLFSYQNKTVSTFSGEETIAVVDLNFYQPESTDMWNGMSKVQPFVSKFVRMACD